MVNVIISTEEEKKESKKQQIISFVKDLLIIFIIVLVIRAFFIAPFQINWDSMDSNFYNKEFILVNRLTTVDFPVIWEFSPYKRWDVIVFEPRDKKANLLYHDKNFWLKLIPDDYFSKFRRFIAWPKTTYIKRIVWLPWETIRIEKGNVYVKKEWMKSFIRLTEDFLNKDNFWKTFIGFWSKKRKEFVIPEWNYFVMWDNRNNSGDSRICFSSCNWDYTAFVKKEYIIWKVWFDMWYFNIWKFSFDNWRKNVDSHPRFLDFPKTYNYSL